MLSLRGLPWWGWSQGSMQRTECLMASEISIPMDLYVTLRFACADGPTGTPLPHLLSAFPFPHSHFSFLNVTWGILRLIIFIFSITFGHLLLMGLLANPYHQYKIFSNIMTFYLDSKLEDWEANQREYFNLCSNSINQSIVRHRARKGGSYGMDYRK